MSTGAIQHSRSQNTEAWIGPVPAATVDLALDLTEETKVIARILSAHSKEIDKITSIFSMAGPLNLILGLKNIQNGSEELSEDRAYQSHQTEVLGLLEIFKGLTKSLAGLLSIPKMAINLLWTLAAVRVDRVAFSVIEKMSNGFLSASGLAASLLYTLRTVHDFCLHFKIEEMLNGMRTAEVDQKDTASWLSSLEAEARAIIQNELGAQVTPDGSPQVEAKFQELYEKNHKELLMDSFCLFLSLLTSSLYLAVTILGESFFNLILAVVTSLSDLFWILVDLWAYQQALSTGQKQEMWDQLIILYSSLLLLSTYMIAMCVVEGPILMALFAALGISILAIHILSFYILNR